MGCNYDYNPERRYQLAIMDDKGKCYFAGPIHTYEEIQEVMQELRDLYEKHGITHHVGYREV